MESYMYLLPLEIAVPDEVHKATLQRYLFLHSVRKLNGILALVRENNNRGCRKIFKIVDEDLYHIFPYGTIKFKFVRNFYRCTSYLRIKIQIL